MESAHALLRDSSEPELRELAAEEYRACRDLSELLYEELKVLLLPRDPNDDRNVIVENRAGAGGEEAALFAYELYRMYNMYAASAGFEVTLLYANETELGGFKEVSFMVEGDGAYSRFKFEGRGPLRPARPGDRSQVIQTLHSHGSGAARGRGGRGRY